MSAIGGLLLLWLGLLAPGRLAAQNSHILAIRLLDAEQLPAKQKLPGRVNRLPASVSKLPESVSTSTDAEKELENLLQTLRGDGYLQARASITSQTSDTTHAELFLGPEMRWVTLHAGNVSEAFLRGAGFRERSFLDRPVRPDDVVVMTERLLRYAEDNGYPFAEVRLDSFVFSGYEAGPGADEGLVSGQGQSPISGEGPQGVSAGLYLDTYRLMILDSIRLIGDDLKMSPAYLRQYLGLREGMPYNETAVNAISTRIRELGFLRETQLPVVQFYADRAVIGLYLEEVNANQFDFLVGVLPNSAITGKLALTGEANLQLFNTLAIGEEIRLIYRRLQAGTQELDLNLVFPYLPYLPIGAHLDFDLYLRDSSFLERGTDFGLRYSFGGQDYLEGFWQNERYVLLNPDTASIRVTRALPPNLDVGVNRYGLAVQRERLDYRYNPRRGWTVYLRGSAGRREVLENNVITAISDPGEPGFDYATLYDSISGSQASFQLSGKLGWFQPIGARSVFHAGWQGGLLQGGLLLQNELFRLGGYRRLRGFDEESIFANHFHIATIEYRFLLGQNSRFTIFGDLAWLEEQRLGLNRRDTPYGFGAGLDFETSAGIFGLSYALGSQRGNPIAFRQAKIHFGYVNRF